MSVSRTYVPLLGKSIPIGRCSELLPNRLQCHRAGDQLVTEVTTETAEKDTKELRAEYQLCNRHALIQQRIDEGAMQPEPEVVPASKPAPPKAVEPKKAS